MGEAVVFFDGVCGLCNRFVDFLMAVDRRQVLRFAPLQGETARQRLGPDAAALDSVAFWDGARVHRDVDAVARILMLLGGAWGLTGRLVAVVPRPLSRWAYFTVARNRYGWFGRRDACRLPTPEERKLFLP